jgi:putative tryptophan/tyrosine transport system substrate-binding protein
MRRREFIGLLAGAAGALTCADVFAAQKSPIARIGFLNMGAPPMTPPFAPECCATPECKSFRRDAYQNPGCWLPYDLNALGWRGGENLLIESRWGYGDPAKLPALAAELVALRPDLLVAGGTIETKAFQAATSDIPIVWGSSTDPVGSGIVDSLARPGRNATGMSLTPQILWGKRLELIAELIGHRPTKVTWLGSPRDIMFKRSLAAVMEAAEQTDVKVDNFEAHEPSDFDRIFAASAGSDAVLVQFDLLTLNHRPQIAELAVRYRLPSIYDNRLYVVDGGLISYGADFREILRRAATYMDRILRGARPQDLPVEQTSKFNLVINLKAAKALGLTIPVKLLTVADEVIE